jgi:hypothetical protein
MQVAPDRVLQGNGKSAPAETKGSVVDSAKSFIAGGFGGASAVLVGLSPTRTL